MRNGSKKEHWRTYLLCHWKADFCRFVRVFIILNRGDSETVSYFFSGWYFDCFCPLSFTPVAPLRGRSQAADFSYFSLGSAPGRAAAVTSKLKCGFLRPERGKVSGVPGLSLPSKTLHRFFLQQMFFTPRSLILSPFFKCVCLGFLCWLLGS